MPVMDGYVATRIIRSDVSIRQKPIIIAMTASALAGDRDRCLEAGMDDYITKPISKRVLKGVLSKYKSACDGA